MKYNNKKLIMNGLVPIVQNKVKVYKQIKEIV